MATYKKIQEYIQENFGQSVKTCWIADMKEIHGLSKRVASNRISLNSKVYPCPEEKKTIISEAFKHFGMI